MSNSETIAKYQSRVGEVSFTKNGTKATLIKYINNKNVIVQFEDTYKFSYKTTYINFKNGRLTNPYESRNKNGIGFIGIGKYNSKDHRVAYHKWTAMIQRCYKAMDSKSTESYVDCIVCDEWLNFQNFAEWFYENLYECDEPLCVDKDLFVHGNKLYSPKTCCLLPQRINLLLVKELNRRGDMIIGAQKHSGRNKIVSTMSFGNKTIYLGSFDFENEAFSKYKEVKEKYIKEVADEYKEILPTDIYDALYKYQILITD